MPYEIKDHPHGTSIKSSSGKAWFISLERLNVISSLQYFNICELRKILVEVPFNNYFLFLSVLYFL